MILCLPWGNVTFCWANILILFLTVSMPRSLEAFNSMTASLNEGPRSCLARHIIVVVFPTPGGPAMMMFGTFPSLAKTATLLTVSWLPTISGKVVGRYFSIQGTFRPLPALLFSPSFDILWMLLLLRSVIKLFK